MRSRSETTDSRFRSGLALPDTCHRAQANCQTVPVDLRVRGGVTSVMFLLLAAVTVLCALNLGCGHKRATNARDSSTDTVRSAYRQLVDRCEAEIHADEALPGRNMRELGRVVVDIQRGRMSVQAISEAAAKDKLLNANVILLGNRHRSGARVRAIWQLIQFLLPVHPQGSVEMGLVLECIPRSHQTELDVARRAAARGDTDKLRALLRQVWAYPVEDYVQLLASLRPESVTVLAGGVWLPEFLPPGDIPDGERVPRGKIRREAYDDNFRTATAAGVAVTETWLQRAGDGRRIALVDYGIGHCLGVDAALMPAFAKSHLAVLFIPLFVKEVELSLIERESAFDPFSWYAVGGFMVRMPYVSASAIRFEDATR